MNTKCGYHAFPQNTSMTYTLDRFMTFPFVCCDSRDRWGCGAGCASVASSIWFWGEIQQLAPTTVMQSSPDANAVGLPFDRPFDRLAAAAYLTGKFGIWWIFPLQPQHEWRRCLGY